MVKRTKGQNITQKTKGTKGIIRSRKSKKTDNIMGKMNRTKGQTTIYKTLHRKLKNGQHEPIKTNNDLQSITQKTKD